MFFAGVGVGGLLELGGAAFQGEYQGRMWLAMLSAACIGGAANALNDYFDLDIDRANRPERPLPAGLVPVKFSIGLWLVGTGIGLMLALMLSAWHLLIALLSAILLYAYSKRLKRTGLPGNLAVTLVLAMAPLYGGLSVTDWPLRYAWLAATFAALTTLARELVKDIQDRKGDALAGARTYPIQAGTGSTIGLVLLLLGFTLLATPLPYLWLRFNGLYLFGVGLANACLLAAGWALLGSPTATPNAQSSSAFLKGAMALGLLALGFGNAF